MFKVNETISLDVSHEALVIGLFDNNKQLEGIAMEINELLDGQVHEMLRDGDISTKSKAITKVHTLGKIGPKRVYFVGLGKEKKADFELIRSAFGKVFKQLKKDRIETVAVALDSFSYEEDAALDYAHAMAEGLTLATYQFADYKRKENVPEKKITEVAVFTEADKSEVASALQVGSAYGQGTNTARTLVNTPPNMLTAVELAEKAVEIAYTYGMEVEILEKEDMEKLGMGALLAVNKGSVNPPKMIVLKYQGTEKWEDVLGLVGKGITYDTGGYSLKPRESMVGMKTDMGGAAAVLGAMEVIGQLKPEQNVVAVIASTDNMISGDALKPDDVITSLSGKTIEVLNTDAEGRLVLADAVTYAKQHGADYLVDVATLTGGVIVALGDWMTGAMTNNDGFYEEVLKASHEAGEPMWLLPYNETYKAKVRSSKIADLNNSPGRKAHPIMAGAFIAEFAEDTPWVHLDIAGTSTSESEHDLGPAGATGVMVRTLAALAERMSEDME